MLKATSAAFLCLHGAQEKFDSFQQRPGWRVPNREEIDITEISHFNHVKITMFNSKGIMSMSETQ